MVRGGAYRITAGGARGGSFTLNNITHLGGRGAVKEATFKLAAGDVLTLVLGKAGGDGGIDGDDWRVGGGGGGGTFVR